MTDSGKTNCCSSSEPVQSIIRTIPVSHEDWEKHQHLKWAIRHGHVELAKRLLEEGVPINVNFDFTGGYRRLTPLHLAVYLGCHDVIKSLLDKGASVHAQDDFSETPLMLSVRLRKYAVTDLLLTADVLDDFEWDLRPMNHLHIACMRNNISAVRKLVSSGVDVNGKVDDESLYWVGYTALHFAVESHSIDIVKLLLDNGADVMQKNANSMTPLHLAHEVRNEAIIDLLLSAQMFVLGNPKDKTGLSHFHIACSRNDTVAVEFFLKQGVDVNLRVIFEARKWSEWQPLMFAIYHECPDVVELLLLHGAYLTNQYNLDDGGHLELAYEIGNEEIVDILLHSRAIKDRAIPKSEGLSSLQLACIKKDVGKIEKLLHRSPERFVSDLNVPLWNGCTPVHYLMRSYPKNVMKILPSFGGSISIKDSRGRTPLHIFFEYIYDDLEALIPFDLLDFENNPSDSRGLTHLHITCATNRADLIEKFIKEGADVNGAVDSNSLKWSGYTPLHFAVKYDKPQIVEVLLKNGAKISTQNGDGQTPFDMAIMNLDIHMYEDQSKKWLMVWNMLLRDEKSDDEFDKRGFSLLHIACSTKIELDSDQLRDYVFILPGGIDQAINFPACKYHQCTPLHFACKSGNASIAKWLIEKGANIYLRNHEGFTPIQHELDSGGKCGILKKNPKLLQVSGNPFDIRGESYFHHGCHLKDFETMKFYINAGVDVNLRSRIGFKGNFDGITPLLSAVKRFGYNSVDDIKYLIDNGADVMARDVYLNTALHFLNYRFNKETAQLLVDCGADVNARNFLGETPLFLASRSFRLREIKFLIRNGADVNIENDRADTALKHACEMLMNTGYGREKVILFLLKHVKKLEVIGSYVSDVNRKIYSEFLKDYELPNFREHEIEEKCSQELQLMKSLKINRCTTVYDIVFKTPNDMTYLIKNATFRELMVANNFNLRFPMYGYLIKLQCKRGLRRKPLLGKCKRLLHSLAKLSGESAEKILDYLDDYDLRNIIACQKTIPCVRD